MASCGSTQGAKLPRPGPGLSATRDRQGSLDPRGSCLHSSAWWQGDCMPSAPPGAPVAPQQRLERKSRRPSRLLLPKGRTGPGSQPHTQPSPALRRPCRWPVLSPPSLLTCETPNLPNLSDVTVSPPTWAPGPAPALPVLRFRLAPHSSATCPSPAPRPRRPCPPPPPGCGSLSAPDERTGGSGSLESCGLRAASQHIGPAPLSSKTLAPSMQSRDGEQSRGGL